MRVCPVCRLIYGTVVDHCAIDGQRLVTQEADPLVGTRIDRYEIIEVLGSGAMGRVYRARHETLQGDLAVKVLLGEMAARKEVVRRFRREAKTLSELRHPRVVAVSDFGRTAEGLAFLVMELVEGRALADVLQEQGPLPPDRVRSIAIQIADGLVALHARGFVHRDLKPGNVMLCGATESEVKIVDFGIVGVDENLAEASSVTRTHALDVHRPAEGFDHRANDEQAQPSAPVAAARRKVGDRRSGAWFDPSCPRPCLRR